MFLGIILGVLIYMSTLSNIVVKLFTRILGTIIKVLELPFKTIIAVFRKIITIILSFSTKYVKKIKIKKGNFANNGE